MENNTPEKHIKCGGVRISIWCNVRKGANGGNFKSRSAKLDRSYKDDSGKWQNTQSLRECDVPKAIEALRETFVFMCKKDDADNSE